MRVETASMADCQNGVPFEAAAYLRFIFVLSSVLQPCRLKDNHLRVQKHVEGAILFYTRQSRLELEALAYGFGCYNHFEVRGHETARNPAKLKQVDYKVSMHHVHASIHRRPVCEVTRPVPGVQDKKENTAPYLKKMVRGKHNTLGWNFCTN